MANHNTSFSEFFHNWEIQHRRYLVRLLESQSQSQSELVVTQQLVEQVLRHYQDYYDEKSKAAESDVFLMFSPPWFSSYERTLLWVSGFKPSVTFRLVKECVGGELSDDQKGRIAVVRDETRRMEREIEQAMASVQESVAAPSFCGLVKREGRLLDWEVSEMENAVEELKMGMMGVMRNADDLRQQTAMRVLEVLSPGQKVKFLAGTSQFWLQSRRLGMERDKALK